MRGITCQFDEIECRE